MAIPASQLVSRNVIYQGDLKELLEKWEGKFIMDGECAKLPQYLTSVGWSGRWQPGPRVVDLSYLLPGTVIANFKFENGRASYPNAHGFHAGLFVRFERRPMRNGRLSRFIMIDQWKGGQPKTVSERPVSEYTRAEAGNIIKPCDNAGEFYVVAVP